MNQFACESVVWKREFIRGHSSSKAVYDDMGHFKSGFGLENGKPKVIADSDAHACGWSCRELSSQNQGRQSSGAEANSLMRGHVVLSLLSMTGSTTNTFMALQVYLKKFKPRIFWGENVVV